MQARRQDGGAGRALRHLGDPVGKFFPLKILAGILYFPVPGVEKKKKLPVPRVTEISTVHLFISNLTRAVWGLVCIVTLEHYVDLERTSRALQLHVTNLCTSVLLHTGSVCSVYAKFCFAVC